MEQDTKGEIVQIKQQLARQSKLLRLSMIGWVGTISVLVLSAVPGLQELKVRRLALVDANGIERLILSADNTHGYVGGKPFKRMFPVSGIILQNDKGDEMGGMMTDTNGSAGIALDGYVKASRAGVYDRVGLFSLANGTARFKLNDLQMKTRAAITSGADLNVALDLFDVHGTKHTTFATGSN